MRIILVISFLIIGAANLQAQSLRGIITDKDTGNPISMASILVKNGSTFIQSTSSDEDGNYIINLLPPGHYMVEFSFIRCLTRNISDVIISPSQISLLNISLLDIFNTTECFFPFIEKYESPLINPYNMSTGKTIKF